jgi:beta-lactam-binding protein with PASTA domain
MTMKARVGLESIRDLGRARGKRPLWWLAVQTLLGILFGLGLFDRVVMPIVVHHSADHKVPDLRGRGVSDAKARLRASNLEAGQVLEVNNEVRPAGTIVAQDPPGGAYVRSGRRVRLLVSAGPAIRQIPDLTGKTARLASIELSQVGLSAGATMSVPSSMMREGQIIGTRPSRGERPEPGGKIDLLVSAGPPRGLYLMPDVRGIPRNEAVRRLRAAGIQVTGDDSEGDVRSQDPPPGSPIGWGDAARID